MSKRLIIIVAVFMSIALIGLIVLQAFWIRNAFLVKEKQFDQLVQKALAEATYAMQRNETMNFIFDEMSELQQDTSFSTVTPIDEFQFDTVIQFRIDTGNGGYLTQDFKISHHTEDGNIRTDISVSANGAMPDQSGQSFDPSMLNKITSRQSYINQLVSRMFSYTPDVEKRITPAHIKKFVGKAFSDNGIKTRYEYAVTKWNNEIAFKSDGFEKLQQKEYYQIKLFPEDFFESSAMLSVYFPNRRNFIIRSLGFIGISSSVLTVFLIITFTFTLYVILRQKQLSEMKSDFVNNMTHELKTPISTISLASQMLADTSLAPNEKNYERISGIISDETKRLGYQVERVLQMAKFDQDDLKLQFEELSLHDIIESVISNFVLQVESRKGMLVPSLHAENDVIWGDKVHIANIISNLLDNAVKYTPDQPEIYIETRNIHHEMLITVRDNGVGISKSNQKRIFDKFFRVSTGNIHNVKGFGLGLSYVKKIIEEHKGSIDLDSEPGVGTSFFVRLPQKT